MKSSFFLALLCILINTYDSFGQGQMVMSVKGTRQGSFKAEAEPGVKSDKIKVNGLNFEVTSPRDAASGMASGRRQYKPITIWKRTGASSPQFLQALTQNEVLTSVTIEFYKLDPTTGTNELSYTIILENATVVGFQQSFGPLNGNFDPADDNLMYDEIELSFQKITVREEVSRTTVTDNTSSRNQ